MLFKMVSTCLESVANQWLDLAGAFQRLNESLPGGPFIPNPDPTTLDNPASLKAACETESRRLREEAERLVTLRQVAALFDKAVAVLSESEVTRGTVSGALGSFVGTLPGARLDTVEYLVCANLLEKVGEMIGQCVMECEEVRSPEGALYNIRGIKSSVEGLASYPLLTAEVTAAPAAPAAPAASGGASLQRRVEGALREVIGRLPRANDTRSFLAALNQSFTVAEVEGRTEFTWTPRSYAGQTDLGGGVTGAQASLAARGRVALDSALPLLDGLYPLLPDADAQEVEAARSIVRGQLTEIVNEFGVEGGPRVQRVDDLFHLLLEQDTTGVNGNLVTDGKLGYLEHVFGLSDGQVNTLEEETNVTNFVVLEDYVQSLRVSWDNFRDRWFGRDLGTRFVLLSRALSVVAESVGEAYAAMAPVYVGAAERQVASFPVTDRASTHAMPPAAGATHLARAGGSRVEAKDQMLVEELLSWILTFASDEAPRLVYEGGRRGVEAIVPTAQRLESLVGRLIRATSHEPSLPDGLRHPRVLNPLRELRGYLAQVQRLAEDVRHPLAR